MSKISSRWESEDGKSYLLMEKSRGKLTLCEIEDYLRYKQSLQGHWAIILNCTEVTCGGSGWFDENEPKGDVVVLFQVDEGNDCPICNQLTPPNYCPHCGKAYEEEC